MKLRGKIVCLFMAAVMLLTLAPVAPAAVEARAEANSTTVESGPINRRSPATYTWDLNTDYTLPAGNYANYLQTLGILFPGDKVYITPQEDQDPNTEGYQGTGGITLALPEGTAVTVGTRFGPLEIIRAETHLDYTFVTGVKVVDAPVMLQLVGNADAAREETVWYGVYLVNYLELPKYVKVTYAYDLPGIGVVTDKEGEYYGHAEDNPQVIWMEDLSLSWNRSTKQYEDVGTVFDIYRPFIQGYSFCGWDWNLPSDTPFSVKLTGDQKKQGQWTYTSFRFMNWQCSFNTKFENKKVGDENTTIQIIFRYSQRWSSPETMTLDANGGLIGSYSSRIVDLEDSNYFRGLDAFPAAYLPKLEDYIFTGWYADKNGEELVASADLSREEMQSALNSYYYTQKSPEEDPENGVWNYTLYAGWRYKYGGSIDGAKVTLSKTSFTYNGKVQKPTIKKIGGKALEEGTDYTVAWSDASSKKAGTYTLTITGTGHWTGTTTATYKIVKAANPIKVTAKTATVKFSDLKKKAQTLKAAKVMTIKKAEGTVTFRKVSGNKSITIDKKTGKVTVKKGLKKGTYSVKIKVTAAGNANYKSASKTVTIKIKVK